MFENRKAKKALEQLTPSLDALDQQLREVEKVRDPIDRLVQFFDAVSKWNDRQRETDITVGAVASAFQKANSNGRHAETIKALETLQTHFRNAGRDEFGMNRTVPGENVTADNVYLGNIYGLWTFTANKWKQKFEGDTPEKKENKQLIEGQAAGFVKSHIEPMHRLIGSLGGPKR